MIIELDTTLKPEKNYGYSNRIKDVKQRTIAPENKTINVKEENILEVKNNTSNVKTENVKVELKYLQIVDSVTYIPNFGSDEIDDEIVKIMIAEMQAIIEKERNN